MHEAASNSYIKWIVVRVQKIGRRRGIVGRKKKSSIIIFVVIATAARGMGQMLHSTLTSKQSTMARSHQILNAHSHQALRARRGGLRQKKTVNR